VDSIVDIVGAIAGLHLMNIGEVFSSPVHLGSGFVQCQHGTIPVPAPATLDILKGVPVISSGIPHELTTPTGACLLRSMAKGFGPMPSMTIEQVGYGAGERDLEIPNLHRIIIGSACKDPADSDPVVMIETNLDDQSPEVTGWLTGRLLDKGALDVFLTPVYMKKNRPGVKLSVLSTESLRDDLAMEILRQATTLGVRFYRMERFCLPRSHTTLETPHGPVMFKTAQLPDGRVKGSPEFESCRQIAEKTGIPLTEVYQQALEAFNKKEKDS